jgi:hypothetical protein
MRASTRARRGSSRERAHAPNRLYGTRLGPSHTRSRLSRPSGLLLTRFRISGGTYGFVGRPDNVPKDAHSVLLLAHEFYHRHVVKERKRGRPAYSREVIELLDKIVDRGAPVMANRTEYLEPDVHVRHSPTQLFPIRRSSSSND